jgi:type II secretion system (T2SS) protein G
VTHPIRPLDSRLVAAILCGPLLVALAIPLHRALRPRRACLIDTRFVMIDVELALVHYQTDHTALCPPSLSTLVDGSHLARLPVDAWGQPLSFACPGRHNPEGADIVSAGPDRVLGTADDLRSWDP